MKIDHSATSKLRAAQKVWRNFHPKWPVSGGRITKESLSFWSTHPLGAGIEARWSIDVSKVDDENCSLQVRMWLRDERVDAIRSIATGVDTSINFLDFDVLALSSMMDRQDVADYPRFASDVQVDQFAHFVGDYSRRINRIWSFVGGPGGQNLERLAIWILRNSDLATLWHMMLGGICAAFAYGEKELAHELMARRMHEYEEFVRLAPYDRMFDVYDHFRAQTERLQAAMGGPS